MSFFDTTMINEPLPEGWGNYDLHTEVNEQEHHLIKYLEKTKWEHFANGGSIYITPNEIDESFKTKWYGLKRNLVLLPENTNANTLLCEVYLCIVETETRILTIVSKNKELSQEEKDAIESKYGKISCIGNNVGSSVGVFLVKDEDLIKKII